MLTNLYCKGPQKNHIHNHNTRKDKPTRGNPGPEHPTPGSCSCYSIVVWINRYIYIVTKVKKSNCDKKKYYQHNKFQL